MSINSELIPVEDNIQDCQTRSYESVSGGYHNPVLLSESTINRLYRISRAGKHFIIKTARDEKHAALIRREYDLSIDLSHPYIINVFTFEEQTPVGEGIVMEYIDGRDLRGFLSENPSRQLRKRVLDQLLTAVSYLHSKGIVHNDLKPENILITHQDNTVKLIDFGLSDTDAQYLYRTLGCSPEYAAPELLARQKTDSRSDIYSLGLLIRDILGNKALRIVSRCRNQDPSRRYANVDDLRKALARRHYPLWFMLAAMCPAAILVAATGVSREMQELKDYKAAQESLRETCDSVYRDIDITLEKMVSDYLGRIKGVPYYDFVIKEYMALHDHLKKYKESWLAVSSDPAILSAFEQHFVTIYNSHVHKIMVDPLLPLLDYAPISPDEMAFYKSLLDNNEPYRPYGK